MDGSFNFILKKDFPQVKTRITFPSSMTIKFKKNI